MAKITMAEIRQRTQDARDAEDAAAAERNRTPAQQARHAANVAACAALDTERYEAAMATALTRVHDGRRDVAADRAARDELIAAYVDCPPMPSDSYWAAQA